MWSNPVYKELYVCLEDVFGSSQSTNKTTNLTNGEQELNEDHYKTTILTNYTLKTIQDEPVTDPNALYKESLLNFEKQYFYQTILHEIMDTSNPKEVKELETQYMEQLRRVSKLEVYKCSKCPYETIQKPNIELHLLLVHNSEIECKILECENCNFISKDSIEMKGHIKIHQTSEKEQNLAECSQLDLNDNFSDRDNFSDADDIFDEQIFSKENRNEEETTVSEVHPQVNEKKAKLIVCLCPNEQKKVFKCSLCNYQNHHKGNMSKHVERHNYKQYENLIDGVTYFVDNKFGQIKYKCEECSYQSFYKNIVTQHVIRIHKNGAQIKEISNKEGMFVCKKCPYQSNNRSYLLKHVQRIHKDITMSLACVCDICDYETNHASRFKIHQVIHEHNPGVGTFVNGTRIKSIWKCPERECEFKINNIKVMVNHVAKSHRKNELNEKLMCELCAKTYTTQQMLHRHTKAVHQTLEEVEELFYCYNCDFKSKFKGSLKIHMETHNKKSSNDFICEICGVVSRKIWMHRHHLKTHEKQPGEIYECQYCDYKTHVKRYFARHMKHGTHTGTQGKSRTMKGEAELLKSRNFAYKCDNCDFTHIEIVAFRKHMLDEHPEIPFQLKKTKKCLKCGYQTSRKRQLCRHYRRCQKNLQEPNNKTKPKLQKEKEANHQLKTRTKSTMTFECFNCQFSTDSKKKLIVHMKKHRRFDKDPEVIDK